MDFVDNNSIMLKLENLGFDSLAEKMPEEAKKLLEVWQRLLHIIGDELKLTKISYSMMTWKLQGDKEAICTIYDAPRHLRLRSEK